MKKLKLSKFIYNKFIFSQNKYYLVFTFFNLDSTIIDLLKKSLEENFNFLVQKIQPTFNMTNFYLEIDIEDYFIEKEELFEFFKEEDFKFYHSAVYYKNNYIQPDFFEKEFLTFDEDKNKKNDKDSDNDADNDKETLQISNHYEFYNEIIFFNFFQVINLIIHNKKVIFFFYNIIFQNRNIFFYKCLQFTKQLQN